MDMIGAMHETLELAGQRGYEQSGTVGDGVSLIHLEDMCRRMSESTGTMSPTKMGRWLGWAQGVLAAKGVITLEEAKQINMRWSD